MTIQPISRAKRGLAKTIAVLAREPGEIREPLHVPFERFEDDDLGPADGALFERPDGSQFALVRYLGNQSKGTEVIVHESSVEIGRELLRILQELNLSPRDLKWSHPDIDLQGPTLEIADQST